MKNWLEQNILKIKEALFKTRSSLNLSDKETICAVNEDLFQEIEEKLIRADVGYDLSENIIKYLKQNIKEKSLLESELRKRMKESITNKIKIPLSHLSFLVSHLNVYLIVGVNGSGKTTSIGKLAKRFKDQGLKVLIVAADTFRAAAGEQLDIWAKRAGAEIYAPPEIKKPDAVVFKAIEKGKKENYDVLLIDTAGRLHSQTNLMEELKKINSVVEKCARDNNESALYYEKLIVLDATIGQNAINQAKEFSLAINLTGIILAKLDSSAKGGVVLNIMKELSLPVKLIGTGEKIDDIVDFNFDEYLDGLLL